MKGFVIAEQAHVAIGRYPIAVAGLTTMDAVNMENYGHLTAIVSTGAANAANTVITASASTNNAAGSAEVIPFHYYLEATTNTDVLGPKVLNSTTALTFGNAAIANQFAVVEIDAAELPDGKPWVNLNADGGASTTPISIVYILSGSRYAGAESPTVLS